MKPSLPEHIERFRAYHKLDCAWGSLHVVLSDGNISDDNVRHCIEWAKEKGDIEGMELAKILLTMSKTQRGKIQKLCGG